jgi:hypothetical protein
MIRVVSWQRSGVAWVPWRIRHCLAGSEQVEMSVTASHAGLESYGLPEVDEVLPDVLAAARGADVIHLHHAYASSELIPVLRDAYPSIKIVVTIHGEPDRSIGRLCQHAPDSYHVVEPHLLPLCAGVPATFIPNHPATIDIVPTRRRPRNHPPRILFPFSHVAQHKDHDVAQAVADLLTGHGWTCTWLRQRVSNANLLEQIALHDACWVQFRGYLDLLTMECWSLGTLPVVMHPGREAYAQWSRGLFFAPVLPFQTRDPIKIVARLLDASAWDSVPVNRAGMAACWVPARVRELFERFYAVVTSPARPRTC